MGACATNLIKFLSLLKVVRIYSGNFAVHIDQYGAYALRLLKKLRSLLFSEGQAGCAQSVAVS